jgi:DNA polymerase-3 subunit delta
VSLYAVKGTDPVLRSRALAELLDELLAGEDRSLAVEDLTVPGKGDDGGADGREAVVAAAVGAAQSPPFMTARRIVLLRDYEHLTTDEVAPILTYLADPLDTTDLVLVAGGGGRVAKALTDAIKQGRTVGPESEQTLDVLAQSSEAAGISLTGPAARLVTDHLGEDAGRVGALVDVLASTFGSGARLDVDDVEPYLGEAGSVPAYTLTNAIEQGDTAGALTILHRLLTVTSPRQPKPMHPLQVLGLLTARYRRLLRLDDPSITTEAQAHAALGGKGSTFPAKKALEAVRGLGSEGLRRAIDLLHRADLELKGASALDPEASIEVLVARLADLSARTRSGSRGGRR